jgi:eukaryotic-like serine/threonine-protein kinase
MKLGGSIARRRPGGGKRRNGGSGAPADRGRLGLVALGILVVAASVGYLWATQIVYPAEQPTNGDFREVPDLSGMSEAEARVALENRGLALELEDSILHPRAPAGRVVGQSPLPGQLSLRGEPVQLTVSLGPERRPVPDVTRLRADRAITVLRTTGFEVTVDSVEADDPEGRVVATRPSAGTSVTLPSEIQVTVSLGPPLVDLPDLTGLQEARVRAILDSLGLAVGEVEARRRFGFSQGEVLETFPAAGERVPRGSPVRLVIGRRILFQNDEVPRDTIEARREP